MMTETDNILENGGYDQIPNLGVPVSNEDTPVLHVYGAKQPNDKVVLVGNESGLRKLLYSVLRALNTDNPINKTKEPALLFHSDGEGYELYIMRRDVTYFLSTPYTDPDMKKGTKFDGELTPEDLLRSELASGG